MTHITPYYFQDGNTITAEDILGGVDEVLEKVANTGDFDYFTNYVRSVESAVHLQGLALAKMLHGAMYLWTKLGNEPNKFYDYVRDAGVKLIPVTIKRYIDVWETRKFVPPQLQEEFDTRPMKDLEVVASAVKQGYVPTIEEWEELADAADETQFRAKVRQIKGAEPRSNSMTITIDDKGTLTQWKNNKPVPIGMLFIDDEAATPGINRIISSAHIQEV